MLPFKPNPRGTYTMTGNAAGVIWPLPPGGGGILQIFSVGPQVGFMDTSSDANMPTAVPSGVAAAPVAGGLAIGANLPVIYVRLKPTDAYAAVMSSGNCTLHVTRGDFV